MNLNEKNAARVNQRVQQAIQLLLTENRELIASIVETQSALIAKIFAHLSMDRAMVNEAEAGDVLDVRHHLMYQSKCLVQLWDLGEIVHLPLTSDGERCLVALRRRTGVGTDKIPAPVPVPPSLGELLEQEVRNDWQNLKTADFRRKCQVNPSYARTFERIADSLESVVTSLQVAGA